jgi:hypothetical protein
MEALINDLKTQDLDVLLIEERLRAQGKQKSEKGRGRLPLSKPGKQVIAGVRTKGEMQKKRGRGRPRKQV